MLSNFFKLALIACIFMAANKVSAEMVIKADLAVLQAEIGRDEFGFSNCGIRGIVVAEHSGYVHSYDFSIYIYNIYSVGLLKSGKSRTTKKEWASKKSVGVTYLPAPSDFWIAKEREGRPLIMQKKIAAENKGFVLGYIMFGMDIKIKK